MPSTSSISLFIPYISSIPVSSVPYIPSIPIPLISQGTSFPNNSSHFHAIKNTTLVPSSNSTSKNVNDTIYIHFYSSISYPSIFVIIPTLIQWSLGQRLVRINLRLSYLLQVLFLLKRLL